MRHVYACAVLCALSAPAAFARSATVQPDLPILTIVLDFRGPYTARSVGEMEREVESIARGSGRAIEWRSWAEATQGVFDELAVVRFNGNCGIPDKPSPPPGEGPLGSTHVSDGVVLPSRIEASPIHEVVFTNSIPLSEQAKKCKRIKSLSIANLLAEAIRSIHEETSVSVLFI